MERVGMGLAALVMVATPLQAIGQPINCFSWCFHDPRFHHKQFRKFHPPFHQTPGIHRFSSPQVIIVPTHPKFHFVPPCRGHHFHRHRFSQPHFLTERDVRGHINQIYREVLGRDADPEGLNTYQERFNSGWSLIDIRRDITNSQEARSLRRF